MGKKVLSVFLAFVFLLAVFPMAFAAAGTEAEDARTLLQNSMSSFQSYSDRIVLEENQLLDAVVIYRNELAAAKALLEGDLQEASVYTTIRASLVSKWQEMRRVTVIGSAFETEFNQKYNDVYMAKDSYTPESWADVEAAYALKTTAIVNYGTDAQCKECMTALENAIAGLQAATDEDPLAVAARNTLASEMPVFQAYSDRVVMASSQTKANVVIYRQVLQQAYDLVEGPLQDASVYPAMRTNLVSAWQNMRLTMGMGIVFEQNFDAAYLAVAVNADLYTPETWAPVAAAYAVKTQEMIDRGTDLECAVAMTNLNNAIKELVFAETPDTDVINARVELYKEVNGRFKDYSERVILPENLAKEEVISYNEELASVKAEIEGPLKTVEEYAAMRSVLVTKWDAMRNAAGIALGFQLMAEDIYNEYAVNQSSYYPDSWAAVEAAYAKVTEKVINYGTDAQSLSIINELNKAVAALESTEDPAALAAKAELINSMPAFRSYSDRVVLTSSETKASVISYRTELANAEALISEQQIQAAEVYTNMRSSLVSKWTAMRRELKMGIVFESEMNTIYNAVSADKDLYTADSWAAVEAAYALKTSSVINYGTDEQCANAISALETAVSELVLLSEQPVTVQMNTLPSKIIYTVGEVFDVAGAEIKVTFADNHTEVLPVTNDMISGFDSSSAGIKTITVTYVGNTVTFEVTVIDNSDVIFAVNGGEDMFAAKGETVSVPISVSEGSEMSNCLIEILYDTSVLTFNGASGTGFFEANETTPGRILIGYISSEPLSEETLLFTLNFTVNAETVSEITSLIFDAMEVVSGTYENLTFNVNNAVISIS